MSHETSSKRKSRRGVSAAQEPEAGHLELGSDRVPDLRDTGMATFLADRDSVLGGEISDPVLPQSEEDFALRDPFSADYIEFRLQQAQYKNRIEGRANPQLRADLLASPHLLEKPAESGSRGAAAVWRSLRDILGDESLQVMDSSGREELLHLKRELMSRKAVVAAVGEGIGKQLQRIEQRLSAFDNVQAEPVQPAGAKKKTTTTKGE